MKHIANHIGMASSHSLSVKCPQDNKELELEICALVDPYPSVKSFDMASSVGPRARGTDHSDFSHREKLQEEC